MMIGRPEEFDLGAAGGVEALGCGIDGLGSVSGLVGAGGVDGGF